MKVRIFKERERERNFISYYLKVMCRIKDVSKCDGEASANNRKPKLIFFYEWVIQAEWEGNF